MKWIGALVSFLVVQVVVASPAFAQVANPCAPASVPNTYVPVCDSEAIAYMRATEDAEAYFAANPLNAYGTPNKLCPAIKTRYNGPLVWVASVPTINSACSEEGGGYTNPVFRAQFQEQVYMPPDMGGGHFDPGKNNQCDVTTGPAQVGNPINMAVGYKIESAQDYIDPIGHLGFSRHYTSASLAYNPSGAMGLNWRHSFQSSIAAFPYKDPRLNRPGGNSYAFKKVGSELVFDKDVFERIYEITEAGQPAGWRVHAPDNSVEFFDVKGRLARIEHVDGDVVVLTYNDGGQLTRVEDRKGRSLIFGYESGALSSVVFPDGAYVEYGYDRHRLISVSTLSGAGSHVSSLQYLYEDNERPEFLTGILDENQSRYATWTYDQYGRAVTSRHGGPSSEIDLTTISHLGGKTTVVNALGESVEYGHVFQFGRAKMASAQKPCLTCGGQSFQSRTYDAKGYPDRSIDFSGNSIDSDYDVRGLLVQVTEAANDASGKKRITQTDWHAALRLPVERRVYDAVDALVAKVAWTHNDRGQVLTSTQFEPVSGVLRITETSYCEAANVAAGACPLLGLVTSVNGPRTDQADVAAYAYYANDDVDCVSSPTTCSYRKGDLWKVTSATGRVTETLKYDGAGRVLSIKDPNGVVTDFEYHPRGWMTARKVRGADDQSESDDQITRIDYWPTGLVKKVIDPDGAFTAYEYDTAHRLTAIADNAGNRIEYTLDNAGNRVQENTKDQGGQLKRTLSRIYNQLGQLATQADAQANPTDFTYDPNGNVKTVTDALGRVASNDYDPLNRLVRTLQDVGGIAAETKFQYDALDNLTRVTDPKGLDTSYTYNGFGDLVQLNSPDTGLTTYTYDSAGNRTSQTDARGVTTTYQYDALNRLTHVGYPTPGLNVTYTYDVTQPVCESEEIFSIGRLTGMQDGSGTTQYCYDRFGNMVRKVQVTNGVSFVLRYAYTKAGRLQTMTYPDGTVVDYVRDGLGQVSGVGATRPGHPQETLLYQATYHPFGPAAGWVYGNGRIMQRSLDLDYRPASIQGGLDGLDLSFGFDAVGNLTLAASGSPPPMGFGYDALGRLTEVRDGLTQSVLDRYDYDKTGNRTGYTSSLGTTSYVYPSNSHRLAEVGGVSRSYDAAGNTLAAGASHEFVYNDAGRMSQVKQSGVVTRQYAYNGRGEQVRRYLGNANTYTLYDEAGRWLGDYNDSGTPIQQAIWMDDMPVGVLANGQMYYVQPDHLGTPRAVIDPVRDVAVWKWDLKGEAFGNTPPEQDADGDGVPFVFDMRFPGQRFDVISRINQNYFRDYEPTVGRYMESDPIGLFGDIATYSYASNKTLTHFDFNGLEPIYVGCAGGSGAVVCDGKGGFEVRNCDPTCTRSCTQAHEDLHKADFTSRSPNRCRGKPRGASPTVESDMQSPFQYFEFECRAYNATQKCLKSLKQKMCLSPECRDRVERLEEFSARTMRDYRCKEYGW